MASQQFLDSIQPVVLVGGRSSRFGRDKLREPMGDNQWLVDRPIRALRDVFGLRVAFVGECDPEVAARADRVIPDLHPGVGPIGGVVSALEAHSGPVFVLSGDVPAIDAATIRVLVDAAANVSARRKAVLANPRRPEPCIAIYFPSALAALDRALRSGRHGLIAAIEPDHRLEVEIDETRATNINEPQDLLGPEPA